MFVYGRTPLLGSTILFRDQLMKPGSHAAPHTEITPSYGHQGAHPLDTSRVTECSRAGATNDPSLLGIVEDPRMQDFQCYNQESPGQVGARYLGHLIWSGLQLLHVALGGLCCAHGWGRVGTKVTGGKCWHFTVNTAPNPVRVQPCWLGVANQGNRKMVYDLAWLMD